MTEQYCNTVLTAVQAQVLAHEQGTVAALAVVPLIFSFENIITQNEIN